MRGRVRARAAHTTAGPGWNLRRGQPTPSPCRGSRPPMALRARGLRGDTPQRPTPWRAVPGPARGRLPASPRGPSPRSTAQGRPAPSGPPGASQRQQPPAWCSLQDLVGRATASAPTPGPQAPPGGLPAPSLRPHSPGWERHQGQVDSSTALYPTPSPLQRASWPVSGPPWTLPGPLSTRIWHLEPVHLPPRSGPNPSSPASAKTLFGASSANALLDRRRHTPDAGHRGPQRPLPTSTKILHSLARIRQLLRLALRPHD